MLPNNNGNPLYQSLTFIIVNNVIKNDIKPMAKIILPESA